MILLSAETKDEPWAWEAREYLRTRLIGEEVWFTAEKPEKATREYGTIYLGKGMCKKFDTEYYCFKINSNTLEKVEWSSSEFNL